MVLLRERRGAGQVDNELERARPARERAPEHAAAREGAHRRGPAQVPHPSAGPDQTRGEARERGAQVDAPDSQGEGVRHQPLLPRRHAGRTDHGAHARRHDSRDGGEDLCRRVRRAQGDTSKQSQHDLPCCLILIYL